MYRLICSTPIDTGLHHIDKWGVIPHRPKRLLVFKNEETNRCFETTDLSLKLCTRNKKLSRLYEFYKMDIQSKKVSTLFYVVDLQSINSISSHLKDLSRKFKKHKVEQLASYWQRDVGEKRFKPHLHVIFIVSRLTYRKFRELFPVIPFPRCNGKITLGNTFEKFIHYLQKKEIYAPKHKRSNSISRKLLRPKEKL
jgi:hypothetical protein